MSQQLLPIKISPNGRFLQTSEGVPFFWLADTAWELFHIASREEAQLYLKNRAERGFTVIQAVALAENDGLTAPNAYGRLPLKRNDQGEYDPTLPDIEPKDGDAYDYWRHMDYIVDLAASLGLYIALLPTWGDKFNLKWGRGPVVFNAENAMAYGQWIGRRYAGCTNIIWVLGGDRDLATKAHFEVVCAMAEGIKAGDGGKHLMTFHPTGGCSSSYQVHEEDWLDFNMVQSGHGQLNMPNYEFVEKDYHQEPVKPVLDGEPCYEDHPIGFKALNGYFDQADVRKAAYWAVFSGAMGHTYGHHSIWAMYTDPKNMEEKYREQYFIMNWKAALTRPGAEQMVYLRRLMESRPYFERVPDNTVLVRNYEGSNHLAATRGESYLFVYSPSGLTVSINMGKITGSRVLASWYNPKDGKTTGIGRFENKGVLEFVPPSAGRGEDWVLVIDDENAVEI